MKVIELDFTCFKKRLVLSTFTKLSTGFLKVGVNTFL